MIARWDPQTGRTQKLEEHLKAVADRAAKWSRKIGKEGKGEAIGYVAGMFHDAGKSLFRWQEYIQETIDGKNPTKIDHSTASGKLLRSLIEKNTSEEEAGYRQTVLELLSMPMMGHHGGLMDFLTPAGSMPWQERLNKFIPEEELLEKNMHSVLKKDPNTLVRKAFDATIEIANELYALNPHLDTFDYGIWMKFMLSVLVDADRLNAFEFDLGRKVESRRYDFLSAQKRFEEKIAKFKADSPINKERDSISKACFEAGKLPKGLYQLTCPTGGGKTLASLRFALEHIRCHENLERIVYGMPYLSIAEQNAKEARKFLGDSDAVLEYHSNIIPREQKKTEAEEQQAKIGDVLAERWDAPVVFTSMVQLLNTFYSSSNRDKRRLHHLANSVIILDEVQSVPFHCSELLLRAMDWLAKYANSTAVLMTATQPRVENLAGGSAERFREEIPEIVPLTKYDLKVFERVRFRYDKDRIWSTAEQAAEFIRDQMHQTNSLLMICNTKSSAKEIYRAVKSTWDGEVIYLSTDLCPAHRKDRIRYIKERLGQEDKPIICITTQLIEAGVDISFGHVIRAMAGIDSISQAAGRCNRHGEKEIGWVDIIELHSSMENLTKLPDIEKTKVATKNVLHEAKIQNGIVELNEATIDRYFDVFYYSIKDQLSFPMKDGRSTGRSFRTMVDALGNNQKLDAFEGDDEQIFRQSFAQAENEFQVIQQEGISVIVPYTGKLGKDEPNRESKNSIDPETAQKAMSAQEVITTLISNDSLVEKKKALRFAQSYSIQLYEYQIKQLQAEGALFPTSIEEVWYLDDPWYGENGLDMEGEQPFQLTDM